LSGWLIAAWFLVLFIVVTVWHNLAWSRLQRRAEQQRLGLDRQAYATEMGKTDISEELANAIYDCALPLCVKGVMPHPDDGLIGFYFGDGEGLEDLIETLFDTLHLPTANRYAPEITPHLDSARDLGIYLQSKVSSS
jgi:hypothetical protein